MEQNSPSLEDYVDRLLKEKNLTDVEPEVYEQLRIELYKRVEDRLNVALLNALPPSKVEKFNELLDHGDTEKVQTFLKDNIIDMEAVLAAELIKFRDIYLGA